MTFSAEDIRIWLHQCAERMIASADELNELDAQLGDGDLGATLEKCAELMLTGLADAADRPSDHFKTCAMACTRASGSSFGTLLAVAFMTAAKETADRGVLLVQEIAPLIGDVNAVLMARGRSNLGDKTALDSLDAIRQAVHDIECPEDLHDLACQAANEAIVAFKMQPNKIGRARMFAEKSIGIVDPRMVAVARMIGSPVG
ncbi:DAK2 domain-containing protein [Paracoccaceae bacterium]|nr:DAK2 domain-containing protein [Paracoccaceae bacterium]